MLWCILIFNMIAVDKNQTQICKLLYTLLLCVTSYCFRANCPGFLLSFGQKAVLRDVRIIRLSTREREGISHAKYINHPLLSLFVSSIKKSVRKRVDSFA